MSPHKEPGIERIQVHCAVNPEVTQDSTPLTPEVILAFFHEQQFPGGDGSGRTQLLGEQVEDFQAFAKDTVDLEVTVVTRWEDSSGSGRTRPDRRPGWQEAKEHKDPHCTWEDID